MKYLLAILTFLAAAGAASEPVPDTVLLRMALVVSDVEASKRFYSYALGYEASFDGDITRPAVVEQLQLADGQTARFVVLRGAESVDGRELEGAMIGLLHVDVQPMIGDRRARDTDRLLVPVRGEHLQIRIEPSGLDGNRSGTAHRVD